MGKTMPLLSPTGLRGTFTTHARWRGSSMRCTAGASSRRGQGRPPRPTPWMTRCQVRVWLGGSAGLFC